MNNITKEKIDYIERELNLNLTQIIYKNQKKILYYKDLHR